MSFFRSVWLFWNLHSVLRVAFKYHWDHFKTKLPHLYSIIDLIDSAAVYALLTISSQNIY